MLPKHGPAAAVRAPATSSARASTTTAVSHVLTRLRCATKAAQIYRKTGNLRAVQLLLGSPDHATFGSCLLGELRDAARFPRKVRSATAFFASGTRS